MVNQILFLYKDITHTRNIPFSISFDKNLKISNLATHKSKKKKDSKWAIKSRKLKKGNTKETRTNNDLQKTTQTTKD